MEAWNMLKKRTTDPDVAVSVMPFNWAVRIYTGTEACTRGKPAATNLVVRSRDVPDPFRQIALRP